MATVDKYIVFESVGDISRDVMATAVVETLHAAHPDRRIVVLSLHPDIWLHNPHVFRVYKSDTTQYFFDDFISGKDTIIFKYDPYWTDEFIYKRKHIIDIWCEFCGVKRNGAMPNMYFTGREREVAKKLLASERPIFLIQNQTDDAGLLPYPLPWSRELHTLTAQDVADMMTRKGYRVVQVRRDDQPGLLNVDRITLDNRTLFAGLPLTKARLFIDGSLHHVAAAVGAPSVITWNTLSPKVHGYDIHTNVLPDITDNEFRDGVDRFVEQFRATQFMPPNPPQTYNKPLHNAEALVEKLIRL